MPIVMFLLAATALLVLILLMSLPTETQTMSNIQQPPTVPQALAEIKKDIAVVESAIATPPVAPAPVAAPVAPAVAVETPVAKMKRERFEAFNKA